MFPQAAQDVLGILSFSSSSNVCVAPLFGLSKPVHPSAAVDLDVDVEVEVIPSDCLSLDGEQILRTSAAEGMFIRTSTNCRYH